MIVIDASSLAKYMLEEANFQQVRDVIYKQEPIYSVDYILTEVTNVIWKEYMKKRLPESEVLLKFEALEIACMETLHIELSKNYIKEALNIGISQKIAIYDSLYLAQASKYGKLLTCDKEQSEIATKLGIETLYIK